MKTRIVLSVIIALLWMGAHKAYQLTQSPIAGVATANQLSDTAASAAAAKFVATGGIHNTINAIGIIALLSVWVTALKRVNECRCAAVAAMAVVMLMTAGCGPAKVLDPVSIKPNETAWVIPLDALSKDGQTKFNSVGFLENKKVSVKRIMVDKVERSTGRAYWDYEWMPAALVVKVDRSLVTREWTSDQKTGTSSKQEGIKVITKDSIKLTVGLTVTATIEEDDASTYLYYHGERPLAYVVDSNVRSFAVAELTRKYGELSLTEAQNGQTEIYKVLFEDAKAFFKTKGISIQYLGNAEGMHYDDPAVQTAINRRYTAEMDKATAQMEQNATVVRNATTVMTAQAQADAAKKLLDAQDATMLQNALQISLIEAQARMEMAKNWNGQLPQNILPSDSPLLLNLGLAGGTNQVAASRKK